MSKHVKYFKKNQTQFIKILFLIKISLIWSCGNDNFNDILYYQEDNSIIFKDNFQLKEYNEVSFPLSNKTAFNNFSICYFEDENQSFVSILNLIEPAIYIYNYNTRQLFKKIILQKEGENGVGKLSKLSSHYIDNLNEVYILNYFELRMYTLNLNGTLLRKDNLANLKDTFSPNPVTSTSFPVVRSDDNKLYIPGHPFFSFKKFKSIASFTVVDLKNYSINYKYIMPKLYEKASWYSNFSYIPTMVKNSTNKKLFVSFPIDPFIYQVEGDTITKDSYVSSKYFKTIQPLTRNTEKDYIGTNYTTQQREEYSGTTPVFRAFLYDKYNNIYIREAVLKPTLTEFKNGNQDPTSSLILLDENFKKIGETLLPNEIYTSRIFFLNKKGLHVAKINKYQENEDEITFGVFKLEKINL